MNKLQKVMDFCIKHQTTLGYSAVSLLAAASELIFSFVVFKCPCNSENMLYGCSFLLVPAFILLLVGYMVNARIWRLVTGKCSQQKNHQYCSGGTCAYFYQLLVLTAKALVAPLIWIVMALFEANFFECAASGSSWMRNYLCKKNGTDCPDQKTMSKMPCDEGLSAKLTDGKLSLQAQSQLLGWYLIASIITVALISTCVSRCCSQVSYLQLKFWEIYSEEEHELFEKKAKEHATKLAERNTNCFFEATDPAPFHTPSKEDWQKISSLYTFDSQKEYYSKIHKYVSTKR
ncbi:CAHM6 protein, partial [Regulus satrapa]|nr:CAHM6 protein [Regulus satrapa]